jgi:hypothetical protein
MQVAVTTASLLGLLLGANLTGCLSSEDDGSASWAWEWELLSNQANQLSAGIVYSICGDQTSDATVNMRWKVASSGPVDIIVASSEADKDDYVAGKAFYHYPALASYGSLHYDREARIGIKSCRTVYNRTAGPVNVVQEYWVEVYKLKTSP